MYPRRTIRKILSVTALIAASGSVAVGSAGIIYYVFGFKEAADCMRTVTEQYDPSFVGSLPVISPQELAAHDGRQLPTLYIGFDCLVFDVTAGRESYYGERKPYHDLVGRDATAQLRIFGGDLIRRKYPAVGIIGQ